MTGEGLAAVWKDLKQRHRRLAERVVQPRDAGVAAARGGHQKLIDAVEAWPESEGAIQAPKGRSANERSYSPPGSYSYVTASSDASARSGNND